MELKFVIPNMEKTFGNLEFAGEDKTEQEKNQTDAWRYFLAASIFIQTYRGQMILWLFLPAEAGEKHFDFEERVKLVNPRIIAEAIKSAQGLYQLHFAR